MLKGALEGREFDSGDATEKATTRVWNELTFDEVQSVFHN
jgi:hypothetical protein